MRTGTRVRVRFVLWQVEFSNLPPPVSGPIYVSVVLGASLSMKLGVLRCSELVAGQLPRNFWRR